MQRYGYLQMLVIVSFSMKIIVFLAFLIIGGDGMTQHGFMQKNSLHFDHRYGGEPSLSTNKQETFYEVTDKHVVLWQKNDCLLIHYNEDEKRIDFAEKHISKKYRGSHTDGIFGFFDINGIKYIALIVSSRETKGLIRSMNEIMKVKLVRLPGSYNESVIAGDDHESGLRFLQKAISEHSLYFSKAGNYDVTRSIQTNLQKGNVHSWRHCDERYFWNFNAIQPLLQLGRNGNRWVDKWIVPVSNVWISSAPHLKVGDRTYGLNLISRRSRHNQGMRMLKRGIDECGHVSNFVETEQILWDHELGENCVCSFLQVRGSMPLFWTQEELWRPSLSIVLSSSNLSYQASSLSKHLVDLKMHYTSPRLANQPADTARQPSKPDIFIVNLIDKQKSQGALGMCLVKCLSLLSINGDPTGDFIMKNSYSDRHEVTVRDYCLSLPSAPQTIRGAAHNVSIALRHIWYDFHAKTGSNVLSSFPAPYLHENNPSSPGFGQYRWREILLHLEDAIFSDDGSGNPIGFYMNLSKQNGRGMTPRKDVQRTIIRTNCIDSLDRTNVLQSTIGRAVLIAQLQLLGHDVATFSEKDSHRLFSLSSSILPEVGLVALTKSQSEQNLTIVPQEAERSIRSIWRDMGDGISLLYAGSRALKSDLEKYGRPTAKGKLRDALNGARRYFNNNFRDEKKQRGIDMLLGFGKDVTGGLEIESWPLVEPPEIIINKPVAVATAGTKRPFPVETSFFPLNKPRLRYQDSAGSLTISRHGTATVEISSQNMSYYWNESIKRSLQQIEQVLKQKNSRLENAVKILWTSYANHSMIYLTFENKSATASYAQQSGKRLAPAVQSASYLAPKIHAVTTPKNANKANRTKMNREARMKSRASATDIAPVTRFPSSSWKQWFSQSENASVAKKTVIFISTFVVTLFGTTFVRL